MRTGWVPSKEKSGNRLDSYECENLLSAQFLHINEIPFKKIAITFIFILFCFLCWQSSATATRSGEAMLLTRSERIVGSCGPPKYYFVRMNVSKKHAFPWRSVAVRLLMRASEGINDKLR